GVLAAAHTFSAHMGWAEMSKAVPIAERAALAALRADSEDPWAHYALGNVYLFTRRFCRRPQGAHGLCRHGRAQRRCGCRTAGTAPRPTQYLAGLDCERDAVQAR